ncbi:hypothetical protein G6F37_012120 [Rhizopus arrhizus]|nr:hypothetical protein G6F38_012166 [Rhizopus arrhizus]KAG1145589.1 hypothetical protein G6F37_012120 [Rhizopus arrhizus]
MAYADDVVCILRDPSDLAVLQAHLTAYSHASNAKVNYHKAQAMSLSGTSTFYLNTWRAPLLSHGISHWHDNRSLEQLVYLGFPLSSNISQRNIFLEKLLSKIRSACNIHSQRPLSLWHVLCLVSAPIAFFDKLKSIMSSFLTYRMFPKISLSTMCLQRSKGGLGVLDPNIQQGALQLRWLMPLMAGSPFWPFSPVWSSAAIRNSIVLPRLMDFSLYHLEPGIPTILALMVNCMNTRISDCRSSFRISVLLPRDVLRVFSLFSSRVWTSFPRITEMWWSIPRRVFTYPWLPFIQILTV